MPTRILLLTITLLIGLCAQLTAQLTNWQLYPSTAAQPIASPTPSPWPNLDRLKNPGGTICGLAGAPKGSKERAAQNQLRNRYHLPNQGFEQLTLEDLLKLPQGEIDDHNKLINYPLSANSHNERAAAIVGYVIGVWVLGCGATDVKDGKITEVPLPKRKGVESAICYVNDPNLCTAQIFITPFVTPDPDLSVEGGRNVFVVNVTRRSRLLANGKRLTSNIGDDWSVQVLRDTILKRWVRFSGWLFFNENYRERAWTVDPTDKIGKPNDRQTAWGLHPVMGIEVDVAPPKH